MDKQTINITEALKNLGIQIDYTLKADSSAYNLVFISFVLLLALVLINKKL